MEKFKEKMNKRGKEVIGKKFAEMNAVRAIRETAWAKVHTHRRWALLLFCVGIIYLALAILTKQPANVFVFLLIYVVSFGAFIRSLVLRDRLSRGLYGTTSSEVRDIISNVLSRQKR